MEAETNPTIYSNSAAILFNMPGRYCIDPFIVSFSSVEPM